MYTGRPRFDIDGKRELSLAEGLVSLLVEERIDGMRRCEATFGNWGGVSGSPDYLYLDRDLLEFGKEFVVNAGDGDNAAAVFVGRIMGLEGRYPQTRPPEVVVLAEDRLQDLRMTRHTRSFEDETDAGIIEQIAREHGLTPDVDIDEVNHRRIAQVNMTDLAFARERARRVDADLWVEGTTLHAVSRSRHDQGEVELSYGRSLREFNVLADLAHQRTSVHASGWDARAKEAVGHEATSRAVSSELDGDTSGADVLSGTLGERAEQLVHTMPVDLSEAQAHAETEFRRRARRFVTGRGITEGDGRILVGTRIRIENLGGIFNGSFFVTHVRHTYTEEGFRTWFAVERPGIAST